MCFALRNNDATLFSNWICSLGQDCDDLSLFSDLLLIDSIEKNDIDHAAQDRTLVDPSSQISSV